MKAKNVAVALAVIAVLALFLWGTGAPTTNTTGAVRVRQDTYCPPTAEEWTDWVWKDEAHSLRCSWEITPPNFLEPDPEF